MSFIGIDVGASFIKAGYLDLNNNRVSHISKEKNPAFISLSNELFREGNPLKYVEIVQAQIERLIRSQNDIQGILMCGQMHGLVLVDDNLHNASNFISWQDQRSSKYIVELENLLSIEKKKELGNELKVGLPIANLFTMEQENTLGRRALTPCSLLDFIATSLCKTPVCTEATNASATGIYNLKSNNWDYDVINQLSLGYLKWPEIVPMGKEIGVVPTSKGKIPMYTPIGDQQAALLAADLQNDEISINIATGSQVSMITDDLESGNFQIRPFTKKRFLKTITHIPAGRSLNTLVKLMTEFAVVLEKGSNENIEEQAWTYVMNQVATVDKPSLKVNMNFFKSHDIDSGGSISEIYEQNASFGAIFYGAFQAMAENYSNCIERISGNARKSLVYTGGLANRFEILRQIIDEKAKKKSRKFSSDADTLYGLISFMKQEVKM